MSSVLESIKLLPKQVKQAWEEVIALKIDKTDFRGVNNLLVAGMGGSALGARIIDSLNYEVLDLPLEVVTGYRLPAYANQKTLVIISSYSGNTEETLACFDEALERKCPIFIITGGGQLAKLAKKKKIPTYLFQDRFNPSRQPRLGLGYSLTATLAFLSQLGFVRITEEMMAETFSQLEKMATLIPLAKKMAASLKEKAIVLITAEHLIGASHAFKNMLNENSKTFAVRFSLPELNHHLLEGLGFPKKNKEFLKILILESTLFDEKIQKRLKVTQEVIAKNGLPQTKIMLKGRTKLIQVFETIYLGGLISYYLALINQVDPATIPWVDYFKKSLTKSAHGK